MLLRSKFSRIGRLIDAKQIISNGNHCVYRRVNNMFPLIHSIPLFNNQLYRFRNPFLQFSNPFSRINVPGRFLALGLLVRSPRTRITSSMPCPQITSSLSHPQITSSFPLPRMTSSFPILNNEAKYNCLKIRMAHAELITFNCSTSTDQHDT